MWVSSKKTCKNGHTLKKKCSCNRENGRKMTKKGTLKRCNPKCCPKCCPNRC